MSVWDKHITNIILSSFESFFLNFVELQLKWKSSTVDSSSTSSSISTNAILKIIEKLRTERCRGSTWTTYHSIWKQFNKFFISLDIKPNNWEDRLVLFVGYLADKNIKAASIKSYISAIKTILQEDGTILHEDRYLLNVLMQACKVKNSRVRTRFLIHKKLLNIVPKYTSNYFEGKGQPYLANLYVAVFSTAYYGLFRVGELTLSPHVVKAKDVHVGFNKKKLLFVLHSSKTHNKSAKPQIIRITSSQNESLTPQLIQNNSQIFCPYYNLRSYIRSRGDRFSTEEQFFVFSDGSPVVPTHMRNTLKRILSIAGFDSRLYSTHSFRFGRALDMLNHYHIPIFLICKIGRWHSNSVYNYLKD